MPEELGQIKPKVTSSQKHCSIPITVAVMNYVNKKQLGLGGISAYSSRLQTVVAETSQ